MTVYMIRKDNKYYGNNGFKTDIKDAKIWTNMRGPAGVINTYAYKNVEIVLFELTEVHSRIYQKKKK